MKYEGYHCVVEVNDRYGGVTITFDSMLQYSMVKKRFEQMKARGEYHFHLDDILRYLCVHECNPDEYRKYIWQNDVKIQYSENPKTMEFKIMFPPISSRNKTGCWHSIAVGTHGNFYYLKDEMDNPVYISFGSNDCMELFLKATREMMNEDNEVWVTSVLELLGCDCDGEAARLYAAYYWTPESYMMRPEPGMTTFFKLSPPIRDRVVTKDDELYVTCEFPKTIDVIKDVTNRLSNRNNGGNTMNADIFKNKNAHKTYKTFIDTLRKNGASMRFSLISMHDGINPNIDICTNTLQILRALETIQPFDIPEIVDYRFYNDKVTVVWFADGSYTKCVVQNEDVFDPDTGIIFCVIKKMLGSNGHEKFNDILKTAHAAHEKVEADKKKAADEKRARKEKNAQLHAKKLAREEKERQKAIDIQKQAYVEAIAEVATTKKPAARKKATKE